MKPMGRKIKKRRIGVENIFGAVAVMIILIDDEDIFKQPAFLRIAGRDGNVVEKVKLFALASRLYARRYVRDAPVAARRRRHCRTAPPHTCIHGCKNAADRNKCSFPCLDASANRVDVRGRMDGFGGMSDYDFIRERGKTCQIAVKGRLNNYSMERGQPKQRVRMAIPPAHMREKGRRKHCRCGGA